MQKLLNEKQCYFWFFTYQNIQVKKKILPKKENLIETVPFFHLVHYLATMDRPSIWRKQCFGRLRGGGKLEFDTFMVL